MKTSATELPLAATDLLLLLRELLGGNEGDVDLVALRAAAPAMSEGQALTRAYLLSEQLNIPEGCERRVAAGFAEILKRAGRKRKLPRARLSEAVAAACARPAEAPASLKRYEEKALNLLRRAPAGLADGLAETRGGGGRRPGLDTRPLTRHWPRELMESPAWSHIESPVPGVPDLPLEDTWVNLTLRELEAWRRPTARGLDAAAWGELSFDRDGVGISLRKALLKVRGLTVIVGLPGAGKSTLVKWVARYVVTEPDCPFGIPVVISLRQYAKERARRPELSIFEYFLLSRGVRDAGQVRGWRSLAAGLLDPPEDGPDTPETFLWLLDGWDEVPPEMRAAVMPEIQAIASYPGVITTRHSGDPLRLPARQYYEIQGLKHGAALEFAYRWLAKTGKEAHYAAIEVGLEESAELRRMARSPFLLTLICALSSNPPGESGGWLPRRRGNVLRETLGLVFDQHNADRKQAVKFGRRDRRDVSRFAYWLLAKAPEGPRYVFDGRDYEKATSREGVFESLLVPSRLIARPSVDSTDFQFLHASFQEYLAAESLLRAPARIPRRGTLLLNRVWKEVSRFLAEMVTPDTEAWRVLWREARQAAGELDKFGIIASRISLLLAAAGEKDGGRRLLGADLRDHMWRVMKRYAAQVPTQLLEAFLELDPTDLARRILDHRIRTGKNSIPVSWLEHVSVFDLEMLFTDHARYREVLALPEVAILCPDLPDWVLDGRPAADDPRASALMDDLEKAVASRDARAARALIWEVIEECPEEAVFEAIQRALKLPPEEANAILLEVATSDSADVLTRGKAVSSLVRLGDKVSRQQLMAFLASREMDDPAISPILWNLDDYPLNGREAGLVLDLLRHSEDPEARCGAAELLPSARAGGVALKMIAALGSEPEEDVRRTILEALADIADEAVIDKLWDLRREAALQSSGEWELWFGAVLGTLEKRRRRASAFGYVPQSDAVAAAAREWALRALSPEEGDRGYSKLAPAVLKFPGLLGRAAGRRLMAVAGGEQFPERLRAAALQGLAQVGGPDAVEFLTRFARRRGKRASDLLKQAACDALGLISPDALAGVKSRQAEVAMARLAFRYNTLFRASEAGTVVMSEQISAEAQAMPKQKEKRIKILLFSANPAGTGALKLDEEAREIKHKVQAATHRDLITIELAPAARPADLLEEMNRHEPHVVQFSGHGSKEGGILVNDDRGNAKAIGGDALAALFESTEVNVQVVVLNACYSRQQAEAVATVVPCVIGMKDTIGDRAARVFAAAFYSALGFGRSVEVAFKQGLAALKLEGIAQSDIPDLITRSGFRASEVVPVSP